MTAGADLVSTKIFGRDSYLSKLFLEILVSVGEILHIVVRVTAITHRISP